MMTQTELIKQTKDDLLTLLREINRPGNICKSRHPLYNHIGVTCKNGKPYKSHGHRSALLLEGLGLEFHTGEYYAIEKHMHRIKDIPSSKTYDLRDMLRHYIHQCDHRDAATYPNNFESFVSDEHKIL